MRMQLRDRSGKLSDHQLSAARRRLLFAFCRFSDRITRVELVAQDVNGPRGGMDMRCRLTLSLQSVGLLEVSHQDVDFETCLAASVVRMRRTVARRLAQQSDRAPVRRAKQQLEQTATPPPEAAY